MRKIQTNIGELWICGKRDIVELLKLPPAKTYDIIWNLAEELEYFVEEEREYTHEIICAKIPDYDVPTNPKKFLEQLKSVVDVLENNGKVLVHCSGCIGRTSIAAAAIKMAMESISATKALEFTKQNIGGPETRQQKDFVRNIKVEVKENK